MTRSMRSLSANLGRCPKCMRRAFLVALGAWALSFVAAALGVGSWAVTAMAIAALGLTALWVAHVIAFALRAKEEAAEKRTVEQPSGGDARDGAPAVLSRRKAVADFARVLVFAAAATAISARAALACVQLPVKCSSNSDCTCSGCCAGSICQPSC